MIRLETDDLFAGKQRVAALEKELTEAKRKNEADAECECPRD